MKQQLADMSDQVWEQGTVIAKTAADADRAATYARIRRERRLTPRRRTRTARPTCSATPPPDGRCVRSSTEQTYAALYRS